MNGKVRCMNVKCFVIETAKTKAKISVQLTHKNSESG